MDTHLNVLKSFRNLNALFTQLTAEGFQSNFGQDESPRIFKGGLFRMKVTEVSVNNTYKASMFEMIFSDKKELLSLYNAVNGTSYADPGLLTINTLENAIYMSMHNDISFVIDSRLSLFEHQSTYSPNLPLRFLFYVSDLYSSIVKDSNLYGTKLVEIPAPKFIIFYNGMDECPDRQELKLSTAYSVQDKKPSLELRATLLNINPGHNKKLMKSCKTLKDYSEYVSIMYPIRWTQQEKGIA